MLTIKINRLKKGKKTTFKGSCELEGGVHEIETGGNIFFVAISQDLSVASVGLTSFEAVESLQNPASIIDNSVILELEILEAVQEVAPLEFQASTSLTVPPIMETKNGH